MVRGGECLEKDQGLGGTGIVHCTHYPLGL